ncbi:MAG TPA: cytochrome C biogenesis protein [Allosphingosinicella sp.]|nr:cytochrome C biogenesis protein [Allosphingosinicella sp.]
MSGWIAMLLLAAAVTLGLWRWVRRDMGLMQLLAAALLVALAGYAMQGRPGLAGAPKAQAAPTMKRPSDFAQLRRGLLGEFDRAGAWLTVAEASAQSGNTLSAVKMLQGQLEQSPRDMDLWLGLADALIQHAGGLLTPSAEMAFNRAAQVAPDHPAPRFFYGLAVARMGQFEAAEGLWREVLAMPQVTENWRNVVAQAQRMSADMQAGGAGGPGMR